jgi:hypothetical protein
MSHRHRHPRPLTRILRALALLAALSGCRSAALGFGTGGPGALDRVQQAMTALYERYAHVHHGAHYEYARKRMAGAVLVPSRIFNDSALWTGWPDSSTRRFEFAESVDAQGVTQQDAMADAPFPASLGDARHIITLRRLGDGEYAWNTNIQIAFGTIRASEVASGIVALLASGSIRDDSTLRADYRTTFPHTTAVLSQLMSLDSLLAVPAADGSALVTLHFSMQPDGLRERYPKFADYMNKYVGPTHYDFHISDRAGHTYFTAASAGPPVVMQARVRGHEFLPLAGGDTPLPDTLRLGGRFTTEVSVFTVGVKQFSAEFVIGHSTHERSWTLRFDQQPEWKLPLGFSHLLGSSLARPFRAPGMAYRVAVRDTAGAQTILSRTGFAEVKEGTMMRFLGGLISRVLLDQDAEVQREEFAFIGETFDAIRRDFGRVLR